MRTRSITFIFVALLLTSCGEMANSVRQTLKITPSRGKLQWGNVAVSPKDEPPFAKNSKGILRPVATKQIPLPITESRQYQGISD